LCFIDFNTRQKLVYYEYIYSAAGLQSLATNDKSKSVREKADGALFELQGGQRG